MRGVGLLEVALQGGSGVLLALLGAAVLQHRQRSPSGVAFGAFAVCFGAQFVVTNVSYLSWGVPVLGGPWWVEVPRLALLVGAVLGILVLRLRFPGVVVREDRGPVAVSPGPRWTLEMWDEEMARRHPRLDRDAGAWSPAPAEASGQGGSLP